MNALSTPDIDTVERVEIIRDLRLGEFDVLVGINLLREGLDMPKFRWWPSWMRTKRASCARSLIDPDHWPAARHLNGKAILYAVKLPIHASQFYETQRRRDKQMAFNEPMDCPKSVNKDQNHGGPMCRVVSVRLSEKLKGQSDSA